MQWIRRHPLPAYLALTFGTSWGLGALYLFGGARVVETLGKVGPHHPLFFLAVYAPAIAALLVVFVTGGAEGLRHYLRRLFPWNVGPIWYAWILLGVPALYLVALVATYAIGAEPTQNIVSSWTWAVPTMLAALLLDPGPVEELGWRGFMLPLLQRKLGALSASIVLGLVWGIWHVPAFFISGLPQNAFSFPIFLATLVCWAILMTAVYNGSGGSIFAACLFHWQINDAPFPRFPPVVLLVLVVAATVVALTFHPDRLGAAKFTDVAPGTL